MRAFVISSSGKVNILILRGRLLTGRRMNHLRNGGKLRCVRALSAPASLFFSSGRQLTRQRERFGKSNAVLRREFPHSEFGSAKPTEGLCLPVSIQETSSIGV